MFGFLIRLGLIFIAVLVVKDARWIDMLPLGLTLIAAHLGILFWEMRYISGTLAHPGLKPSTTLPIHAAASSDGDTSMAPIKCSSPLPCMLENRGSSDKATFMRKVAEWLR